VKDVQYKRGLIESGIFIIGLLTFTYFVQEPNRVWIIAIAALALAIYPLVSQYKRSPSLTGFFGFGKWRAEHRLYLAIAVLGGALLGMVYRDYLDLAILPRDLRWFVLVSMSIGATEELLFRGYLQTRLAKINVFFAIAITSIAHTAYKILIFVSHDSGLEIHFSGLLIWTLAFGLVIGWVKEKAGTTLIPLIAHITFDLIVYGDYIDAPWWVWG